MTVESSIKINAHLPLILPENAYFTLLCFAFGQKVPLITPPLALTAVLVQYRHDLDWLVDSGMSLEARGLRFQHVEVGAVLP